MSLRRARAQGDATLGTARRERLAAASCLALLVGLSCVAPPTGPPPIVEYFGCTAVLEPGGVCVLSAQRRLRLWVESPHENRIDLRVDGRRIQADGVAVREGQRLTVAIPPGAKKLEVRVEDPRKTGTWSLALVDATGGGDRAAATTGGVLSPRRDVIGEIDAQTTKVYGLLRARDLAAARATLADLVLPSQAPGDARYLLAFYRALLAEREGDFRAALAEVHQAIEIAERVQPARHLWLAEEELALLLRGIGRSREAALLFSRLRQAPQAGSTCEEAQLLNNLAWSTLLAREAGEDRAGGPAASALADPGPLLEEALAKYESCPSADAERKVNVLINLALAHLQEGRAVPAAGLLARAHALEEHPPLPHQLWWLDLEGRIALAEGRQRAALERFTALEELAAGTGSFDGRLRAAFGLARCREALGDSAAALAALADAEALLDEQSLQIPLDAGRETFLAARSAIVSLHVALLLDQGRSADALAVTRRARSRVLRLLAHLDGAASVSAEARARRAELLTAYQQRRAALEQRASDDWRLPADQLRHERAARKAEALAVTALLDQAYEVAGGASRAAAALPSPQPGELLLVYHPLAGSTWVGFAADRDAVVAQRFELPAEALATPEALAERLLLPFRAEIARAARLRILASGRLAGVDVHALPFAGQPVLAGRPVVYGLDLPSESESGPRGNRALLVTDPRGDLPGAREEAEALRASLVSRSPAWSIVELEGGAAATVAVREHLATSDLLHYAGHADYSGLGGWESSLLLADGTRMTLGDLLALDRVPSWVVLSGCETGRASDETPVAGLGLAHAFLLAGARDVIGATRPADDRRVPAFFAELYRRWAEEPDLARAMQRAQLAWREREPAEWAIFRLFER